MSELLTDAHTYLFEIRSLHHLFPSSFGSARKKLLDNLAHIISTLQRISPEIIRDNSRLNRYARELFGNISELHKNLHKTDTIRNLQQQVHEFDNVCKEHMMQRIANIPQIANQKLSYYHKNLTDHLLNSCTNNTTKFCNITREKLVGL